MRQPKIRVYYCTSAAVPDLGTSYMHCGKCLKERPADQSPMEFARQQMAITVGGMLQLWCTRHEINIAVIAPSVSDKSPFVGREWE